VLRIVEIQLIKLASNDLINAREHNVINWRTASEDFNKRLLVTNIANFSRSMRRIQTFYGVTDIFLVG
jgi:hypothetical protein